MLDTGKNTYTVLALLSSGSRCPIEALSGHDELFKLHQKTVISHLILLTGSFCQQAKFCARTCIHPAVFLRMASFYLNKVSSQ